MNKAPAPSPLAYSLLIAMSVVSFGGPFVLMLVIGGGQNPKWPPDRPVEWLAFGVIVTMATVLFMLCLSIRLWLPMIGSVHSGTKGRTPARQDSDSRALSE